MPSPKTSIPRVQPPRRIEKPWGYEVIWADTDAYVGKLLFIRAGESLSLQYHRQKDETLYLLSGELELELGSSAEHLEVVSFGVGDCVRLTPGVVHRMTAVSDASVLEASTAHLDDVVRLEDRYGRVPVTDAKGE